MPLLLSGFLRRRLIPCALPNTSSLGRKEEGQWVDLKEPFEIKVYEIDDMERLQRRTEVSRNFPFNEQCNNII